MELRATTASPDEAEQVAKALNGLQTLAQGALWVQKFKGGEQARQAAHLQDLLEAVKLGREGSDVIATAKADPAAVLPLIRALTGR